MFRYALALTVLGLMLIPTVAQAQFKTGDFELTLNGVGSNDKDFRTVDFAVNGSLGYFFTDALEIGVRQGIIYGDGGSSWSGDTRLVADYHFGLFDKFYAFAGGNIGYRYGDATDDSWIAGPEAGVKYFLNTTTNIQAIVSYEFDLNEGFDNGAFFYGLGLGVRL